jgi:bacterioferritin-associated ferredoxin
VGKAQSITRSLSVIPTSLRINRANQIAAAAKAGCVTVEAIGEALQAGTNCGSCRAEIRAIINAYRLQAAE